MKILLGCPYNGTVNWNSAQSAWRCSAKHEVEVASLPTSLLALGFNSLLAEALNRNEDGDGIAMMAMLHADLSADGFWIDTLVDILESKQADFVSVVNAIKDDRGVTSSGVGIDGHAWKPWKRFTMRQLAKWPATFNAEDIGFAGFPLLHNTGCWLADLRKPVFHQEDEDGCLRAFFTINDRVKRTNGKWKAEVEPEDWFFSRRLHELGANTYVTREVTTHHYGGKDFTNTCDWGTRLEDTDVLAEWGG